MNGLLFLILFLCVHLLKADDYINKLLPPNSYLRNIHNAEGYGTSVFASDTPTRKNCDHINNLMGTLVECIKTYGKSQITAIVVDEIGLTMYRITKTLYEIFPAETAIAELKIIDTALSNTIAKYHEIKRFADKNNKHQIEEQIVLKSKLKEQSAISN